MRAVHSSQDTMQPEVRTTVPGNRGAHAIACGIPAGNIESRQHGFMQYTRDCHARPAGMSWYRSTCSLGTKRDSPAPGCMQGRVSPVDANQSTA